MPSSPPPTPAHANAYATAARANAGPYVLRFAAGPAMALPAETTLSDAIAVARATARAEGFCGPVDILAGVARSGGVATATPERVIETVR